MPPDPHALRFLGPQLRDHGGRAEIAPGCWLLFAVEAADLAGNQHAVELLAESGLPHEVGASEDDGWLLYYVDEATRPAALHWLDDLAKIAAGEIRPVSPVQQALIHEVIASDRPHRAAKQLAELHERGEICAGLIHDAGDIRALLDRLHVREPLFFAAFQTLLAQQLIDLVVLHRQLIAEDLDLKNEIVKAGLSRDPFLQSRQDATVAIRAALLRFRMINPLDQQKNTSITNPYAVYLELVREGSTILAPIDGLSVALPRENFIRALHAIRRNVYRGESFGSFDTQAPWIDEEIALAFRYIKQRVDSLREHPTLDVLYMMERAAEP